MVPSGSVSLLSHFACCAFVLSVHSGIFVYRTWSPFLGWRREAGSISYLGQFLAGISKYIQPEMCS